MDSDEERALQQRVVNNKEVKILKRQQKVQFEQIDLSLIKSLKRDFKLKLSTFQ